MIDSLGLRREVLFLDYFEGVSRMHMRGAAVYIPSYTAPYPRTLQYSSTPISNFALLDMFPFRKSTRFILILLVLKY
jgi:hypothetical protein